MAMRHARSPCTTSLVFPPRIALKLDAECLAAIGGGHARVRLITPRPRELSPALFILPSASAGGHSIRAAFDAPVAHLRSAPIHRGAKIPMHRDSGAPTSRCHDRTRIIHVWRRGRGQAASPERRTPPHALRRCGEAAPKTHCASCTWFEMIMNNPGYWTRLIAKVWGRSSPFQGADKGDGSRPAAHPASGVQASPGPDTSRPTSPLRPIRQAQGKQAQGRPARERRGEPPLDTAASRQYGHIRGRPRGRPL